MCMRIYNKVKKCVNYCKELFDPHLFMTNDVIRALQDLVEGIVHNPLSHELDMDLIDDDIHMVLGIFLVVSTMFGMTLHMNILRVIPAF